MLIARLLGSMLLAFLLAVTSVLLTCWALRRAYVLAELHVTRWHYRRLLARNRNVIADRVVAARRAPLPPRLPVDHCTPSPVWIRIEADGAEAAERLIERVAQAAARGER